MEQMELIVWLAAFVVFAIVEAVSVQLVSVWFSLGSLVAFVAALFSAPFWAQCIVFVLSSIVFILLTRPLSKRLVGRRLVPTNADSLIGTTAVVTEQIDNFLLTGKVLAAGLEWTARSEDNGKIKKDTAVTIVRIDGVKLIVRPQNENF